jgi:polysaccharide export outer membrane protein
MSMAPGKLMNCLFGKRVFTCLALGLVVPAWVGAQQTAPSVPGNIEQNSGSTQRRQSPVTSTAQMSPAPEGFETMRLAPGYLLQMDVYDTPEMSTTLRIDAQGDATVPLIGTVHIGGESLSEAQNTISRALTMQEILKDPQVTLNVLQYSARDVSVMGEVQTPGRVPLLAPTPLGDVLALAGGETLAAGNEIEIQHKTESGEVNTQRVRYLQNENPAPLESPMVEPGDTVLVKRAGVIYILGAVNRPGGYLMVNGGSLSVIQAVSLAGGTILQASTKSATVVRRQGSGFVEFKVPLAKMETGHAAPVQLQLNDALYIPISGWKTALISGSGILGAVGSAAIYKAP